ncbi:MAG TPA: tetratricopeptide repeat protein, partial [Phycisphaerales bacterium]|nr:tetratricopeptide repeat protein [Phycisphaerales bacterium]
MAPIWSGTGSDIDRVSMFAIALEKTYGPEHHLLVPTWLTMARIYQAKKNYTKAEELLQKALVVVEKKQGYEH